MLGAAIESPVDGITGSYCPKGHSCPSGASAPLPCLHGTSPLHWILCMKRSHSDPSVLSFLCIKDFFKTWRDRRAVKSAPPDPIVAQQSSVGLSFPGRALLVTSAHEEASLEQNIDAPGAPTAQVGNWQHKVCTMVTLAHRNI